MLPSGKFEVRNVTNEVRNVTNEVRNVTSEVRNVTKNPGNIPDLAVRGPEYYQ